MGDVMRWLGVARVGTALMVVGAFLAGAGLILLLQTIMAARTPTQTVTVYQDWRVICPGVVGGEPTCTMTQDLVQAETGRTVVRLAMGQGVAAGQFVAVVPLDVLIPAGLGIAVGENTPPLQVAYETCDQQGCMAFVPLDDGLRTAFAGNAAGRVIFAGLDAKPISLNFSLNGFTDASNVLARENARRAAWWSFLVGG